MKRIAFIILTAALACAACTKTEKDGTEDSRISFSIADTKAVMSAANDLKYNGSTFAVVGACSSGASFTNSAKNVFGSNQTQPVSYSTSSSKWEYSPVQNWKANSTYRFRAVWPAASVTSHKDDLSKSGSFTYAVPSNPAEQVDLLMSDLVEVPQNVTNPVALTFRHLLTRIKVKINKDDADPDSFKLKSVTLSGAYDKGNFDCNYVDPAWVDSWTLAGKAMSITKTYAGDEGNLAAGNVYTEIWGSDGLLLIPQSLSKTTVSLSISYSVTHTDGGTTTRDRVTTISLPATPAWEAGNVLTYKLTLSERYGITFEVVSIDEWGSDQLGGTVVIQ